jgi:hypothetical protein
VHPNAIESLVAKFTCLATSLAYPEGLPNAGASILTLKEPTSSFTYTDDGPFLAVHTLLFDKHRWSQKWSSKNVERKITDILHKVVDRLSTTELDRDVRSLVEGYEGFNTRMGILVPIVGLSMTVDELLLGRVTLHRQGSNAFKAFVERSRSIIMQNETYTPVQREEIWTSSMLPYWVALERFVCAEFSAVADRELVEELALTETRRAIDLLRYTLLFAEHRRDRTRFGIQGETATESRTTVAVNEGNTRSQYTGSMVNHPFEINETAIQAMTNIGVVDLSGLLQQDDLTEFEESLLSAVHWLSSGQNQDERENAVLNFITALEVLISPSSNEPITAVIAESVALLLGDDLANRRRIRDRVRALYGLRSGLTHGEKRQIADHDIAELIAIARNVTARLIRRRHQFPNKTKLREWLDEQKLGGPPNPSGSDPPPAKLQGP